VKNEVTRVAFRVFNDGDVIALFPDIEADSSGNILSYQRIGQHGAASPDLMNDLSDVWPAEYASLKRELESIGYLLEVIYE
jgi:hypothetical protein